MKSLKMCKKCGNVMALRTIINREKKRQKILQCFICRHWEQIDPGDMNQKNSRNLYKFQKQNIIKKDLSRFTLDFISSN